MKKFKNIFICTTIFTFLIIFMPITIKEAKAATRGEDIVSYAKNFIGVPYVGGCMNPNVGFDCSGLACYVYSHFGYNIGRTTYDQVNIGEPISYSEMEPGDLVFMLGSYSAPRHVGIYVGNGQVIHAPGRGGAVRIDNIYHFVNARRIVETTKYNCWDNANGYWCYYNDNGYLSVGWNFIPWGDNKSWYYFDNNGAMLTGWHKQVYDDGNEVWYYLNESGAMISNSWYRISFSGNDEWFYFNENGGMLTGWQKINYGGNDEWFYFDSYGVMVTGWYKVNDTWYYFNENGIMLTGWQKINYDNKDEWFYFDESGAMLKGWQYIKGDNNTLNWHYFDGWGRMIKDKVVEGYPLDINGIWNDPNKVLEDNSDALKDDNLKDDFKNNDESIKEDVSNKEDDGKKDYNSIEDNKKDELLEDKVDDTTLNENQTIKSNDALKNEEFNNLKDLKDDKNSNENKSPKEKDTKEFKKNIIKNSDIAIK